MRPWVRQLFRRLWLHFPGWGWQGRRFGPGWWSGRQNQSHCPQLKQKANSFDCCVCSGYTSQSSVVGRQSTADYSNIPAATVDFAQFTVTDFAVDNEFGTKQPPVTWIDWIPRSSADGEVSMIRFRYILICKEVGVNFLLLIIIMTTNTVTAILLLALPQKVLQICMQER